MLRRGRQWSDERNCSNYTSLTWAVLAGDSSGTPSTILSRQIGLATNIFHADPGTPMENHPQPTEDEIIELAEWEDYLYRKYPDARTIYDISMRNTIDWEVHNGYMN